MAQGGSNLSGRPTEALSAHDLRRPLGKAVARLDGLIEKHRAANGPLTMGALHEARARVALLARDKLACELHAGEMEKHYLGTSIASLAALCEAFRREQRRAFQVAQKRQLGETGDVVSAGFGHGPTALERVLADEKDRHEGRVTRALATIAEDLGDVPAALFLKLDRGVSLCSFVGGDEPPVALQKWAEGRVPGATHDDVTQTDFAESDDPDVFVAKVSVTACSCSARSMHRDSSS